MTNNKFAITLVALSVLMLIIAITRGLSLPAKFTTLHTTPSAVIDSTTTRKLSLINRATTEYADSIPDYFTGAFDNPFRQWNAKKSSSSSANKQSAKPSRAMLSLKGVLLNSRPLAILDNGTGETQIRAAGEQAFNQQIISITSTRVVIRDHLGTYEITVEEE